MALYIPHSIFHLTRLLYVKPEILDPTTYYHYGLLWLSSLLPLPLPPLWVSRPLFLHYYVYYYNCYCRSAQHHNKQCLNWIIINVASTTFWGRNNQTHLDVSQQRIGQFYSSFVPLSWLPCLNMTIITVLCSIIELRRHFAVTQAPVHINVYCN